MNNTLKYIAAQGIVNFIYIDRIKKTDANIREIMFNKNN